MEIGGPMNAALLRRLDWRYMLPTPSNGVFDRMIIIGGTAQLADAARAAGLARHVATQLGEPADLVAMLSPARADPADIVRSLRPGATLYVEIDRRLRGNRRVSPRRLAATLQRHGLSVNAQHALRPSFEKPELFVPIDHSGALAWFLSSVYIASSPAKRIAEAVARRVLRSSGRRIGAIAPFHATIAVVPRATGTDVMNRVFDSAGLSGALPSTAMIIHGGHRVAQFGFTGNDAAPLLVVKIAKQRRADVRTVGEHDIMRRVRASIGEVARTSVPEPKHVIQLNGVGGVAVEGPATGISLARSCARWGRSMDAKIDDLRLATAWLIDLHRHGLISDARWDADRRDDVVEQPLAEFASRFRIGVEEAQLFESTRAAADALAGTPLPVVWEHGDFTIWNVFRDGDTLNVLDWESCERGIPLADMIRLATHWHEAARGLTTSGARQRSFADLFCDDADGRRATLAARECVSAYESELGLDPRFRSVVLVMSRVQLAIRRYDHQRGDGTLAADGRAGNAALEYLSTLVARRHTLFPSPTAPMAPIATKSWQLHV
ncbi:MAG TPA: phosphotransferase [Ilumatobacteraceae bacterium]